MQKLCHIDIEGKSGRKNLAFAKKALLRQFFILFSHLPDNSIFTGWKNSVYFYLIAELDSLKQFKNFLNNYEKGFFFRLLKYKTRKN